MASDIAIIGAGYVGLPLAVAFGQAGKRVHCIDTDPDKVAAIGQGRSYIGDVSSGDVAALTAAGLLTAGADFAAVAETDAILICVPTPLSENREPDVSIIAAAAARRRPAPAARPAGGAGVDHLSGYHPRAGGAAAGAKRPVRRQRLPPGHVA